MFLNIYILAMHRLLLSEDNHLKEEDRFILICPLKNTCSVKRKKKKNQEQETKSNSFRRKYF